MTIMIMYPLAWFLSYLPTPSSRRAYAGRHWHGHSVALLVPGWIDRRSARRWRPLSGVEATVLAIVALLLAYVGAIAADVVPLFVS